MSHIGDLGADRVAGRPHVDLVARALLAGEERRVRVRVVGGPLGGPGGGEGRERLVEPQVVPPTHRHQVPEPHVRHLVQQDHGHVLALPERGAAAVEHGVAPGDAAPVLHGPAQVRDEHLVVPLLREGHAEPLPEERQALLGQPQQLARVPLEEPAQGLPAVEPEAVVAALLADLVERSGVDHHDVRRQPGRVRERPDPAPVLGVRDGLGAGVARDRPGLRCAHREAVRGLEVGLVEARPRPAGAVGLERAPDVDQLVGGVDGAQDRSAAAGVALHGRHDENVVRARCGSGRRPSATVARSRSTPLSVARCSSASQSTNVDAPGSWQRNVMVDVDDPVRALEHAAQVDLDVVALDLEQVRSAPPRPGRLRAGWRYGGGRHTGTVTSPLVPDAMPSHQPASPTTARSGRSSPRRTCSAPGSRSRCGPTGSTTPSEPAGEAFRRLVRRAPGRRRGARRGRRATGCWCSGSTGMRPVGGSWSCRRACSTRPGEDPEQVARRELLEEAGYQAVLLDPPRLDLELARHHGRGHPPLPGARPRPRGPR